MDAHQTVYPWGTAAPPMWAPPQVVLEMASQKKDNNDTTNAAANV